jgi:hypothetical protein
MQMVSDIRSDHLTGSAPRFQPGISAGQKHVNWAKTGPYAVSQAAARELRSLMPGLGERAARVEDFNCE